MTISRFEQYVEPEPMSGCWLWSSYRGKKGYGKFWMDGRCQAAHRVAYRLYNGEIPEGLHVLHSCDNTSCVNPRHLHVGTNQENHNEKMSRNRNVALRGEQHGNAQVTEKQILFVVDCIRQGLGNAAISQMTGIKRVTICAIRYGRIWRWLTGFAPREEQECSA